MTAWNVLAVVLAVAVVTLGIGFALLASRMSAVLARTEAWLTSPAVRPPGLQAGSQVHPFTAVLRSGQRVSELDLLGRETIFLFVKAQCGICRRLARSLTHQHLESLDLGARVYVVVRDEEERRALALDPTLDILFQDDGTVAWAFRSSATPQAFLVNPAGVVLGSGFPNTPHDLLELENESRGGRRHPLRSQL